MATVTMTKGGHLHATRHGNTAVPYLVELDVDFAKVAEEKGSAIAAADVLEVLTVPAGTLVLYAGAQVLEEITGTSADLTVDFGVTGGDVDRWVDGWDLDAAVVGEYAPAPGTAISPALFFTATDTLDVLVATQTGTVTGGKVRFFACLLDISDRPNPGRAQIGS